MTDAYEKLLRCTEAVKQKIGDFQPRIALVLGTGLGGFGSQIHVAYTVDYHDIPGFPVSTVVGHSGKYLFGWLEGVPVVVMHGRVHYYEGYSMEDVCLPIRLMGLLGAKVLFLTNGVGAINRSFHPGDLMLIRDHLSFFIPSPLLGKNMDQLGPRFPDMTRVYDPELRHAIRSCAEEIGISLKEGVYVQLTGPQYETPEEIRILERLGGDVVGMSTVCEAIAGNHMGLRVCGISAIGNMGAGITGEILTHEPSETVDRQFAALVTASVRRIAALLP